MQYVAHVKTGVVWQPQQQPNYLTTLTGTAPPNPNAGEGPTSTVAIVRTERVWQPQQKPYLTTLTSSASDVRIGLDTEGWPQQTFSTWDFAQKGSLLVLQPTAIVYNPATDVTRLQPLAQFWGRYQEFVQPQQNYTVVLNPPAIIPYVPATDVTRFKVMPNVWNDYQPFPTPTPGLRLTLEGHSATKKYVRLFDAIFASVNAGFVVQQPWDQAYDPQVPFGYVISQSPPAGAVVPYATPVHLVWSLGPAPLIPLPVVPKVVGLTSNDAIKAFAQAGLMLGVGQPTYQFSTTVPGGYVISQVIAPGATVQFGTMMSMVVSMGMPPNYPTSGTLTMPLVH